jgi:putative ABC transport system substrate-binding protein
MRRREFIALLGSAAAAWPRAAWAQQPERMRRIGMLQPLAVNDPEAQLRVSTFRQRLEELGWTDGYNVRIDYRWASGDAARIRALAAELVSLKPDAILGGNAPHFVEVGEAGIAVDDATRRQRRVQLVG